MRIVTEIPKDVLIIKTIQALNPISFATDIQREAVNLHYLGVPNCNVVDEDGKIITVDHPNMDEVRKAQWNINGNYALVIEADLLSNGRLINFRVLSTAEHL